MRLVSVHLRTTSQARHSRTWCCKLQLLVDCFTPGLWQPPSPITRAPCCLTAGACAATALPGVQGRVVGRRQQLAAAGGQGDRAHSGAGQQGAEPGRSSLPPSACSTPWRSMRRAHSVPQACWADLEAGSAAPHHRPHPLAACGSKVQPPSQSPVLRPPTSKPPPPAAGAADDAAADDAHAG